MLINGRRAHLASYTIDISLPYILGILSMPVLATKTGQAPNTQHRAAPSIGNNFS